MDLNQERGSRRIGHGGFTIVELMVVICIIGILVAVLLPAVQHAREAARRTTCSNNLKQIGLALESFHDSHKHYPPGITQDPNSILPDNYNQPSPPLYENGWQFSWLSRILPYVEQRPIYDQMRFDEWPWPNPSQPLPGNTYLNEKIIPVYNCPNVTDHPYEWDVPPLVGNAHTHYLGVNGTDQFQYDGILHVNSLIPKEYVRDGTSNTFLVGERPPPFDGVAGWWLAGSGWYPWFGAADVVLGTEERIANNGVTTPTCPTSFYQEGRFDFQDDGFGWDKSAWHFWSAHDGGAYFLFADGGIRFVRYDINLTIFRWYGTYKGGEATTNDAK